MTLWATGDVVVDALLHRLERLDEFQSDSDAAGVHDFICTLIEVFSILPEAVSRHFKLPNLQIGDLHYKRDANFRRIFVESVRAALVAGLNNAKLDETLKKGGGAILNDRKMTLGEWIEIKADAFHARPSDTSLSELLLATSGTTLYKNVKKFILFFLETPILMHQNMRSPN
jgi:hypothetical protein